MNRHEQAIKKLEADDAIEKLSADVAQQEATQARPYSSRTSLTHKGKFAEKGTIFLIVEARRGNNKYTNAIKVFTPGLTDEIKEAFFERLWQPLKQKFIL